MPIYEYQCRECSERFETLVRSSDVPACPKCDSENLQKLISAHSIGSGAPDTPCGKSPCSSSPVCGPGGCAGG